jgi:tryptophanyl-tRNA synthetase
VKRLFSGIQPSGELHVGNYVGAVRNWVRLQDEYACFYCIVDYHAITQPYAPADMPGRTLDMAVGLLAAGIDPAKAVLFRQSDVPEHTELAWILASVTPMGELGRMTQFKEKSEQAGAVTAGLFTYPILQAADILLYKAEVVPIGDDQDQHLEISREIVRRFNARYGKTFPEPATLHSEVPRLMGLDGKRKMSKSLGNTIALLEGKDAVWEKLRPAMTDAQRQRRTDPGRPEVCNIYTMHKALTPASQVAQIDRDCRAAAIGCIDCKKVLLETMDAALAPIRERARELAAHPGRVREVLGDAASRCRAIAQETLREVRGKMGLA